MVDGVKDVSSREVSDARFRRTVERIGAEAFWLRTYQAAINGMKVDAIGLDFFRVSLNALKDALGSIDSNTRRKSPTRVFLVLAQVKREVGKASCAFR